MTPERWRRIEELFDRAVDLTPSARAALLEAACAGDDELRTEVEELVASRPGAVASLHGAIAHGAVILEHALSASRVGTRLGAYRLREIIGEGGMGTVYRATRDDAEYQREVAVKILRSVAASPALIGRLRDERQLLASLDHPGIVRLLDGGSTDEGLPYLVMEYIAGVPLTAYARDLSVRARVELVIAIGTALQYAHQKLIVHRDVKPSNIVVDDSGAPKLLDFGIAKLLDPQTGPRQAETATGMPLFTVEYASPEQARGERVSVVTDVYSLGAVLYELLTGRAPQQRGATLVETLANICERDPPRPSVVAPARIRRQLAGDLDNIVLKALQKSSMRRYPSVALLVDDLERYLDGRPVVAREATLGYRAGKFIARNRGKLALAALAASTLSAATAVSILQARRADRHAAEAERQKRTLLSEHGLQELVNGHPSRALPYLVEALREGDDSVALHFLIAEAMRPFDREITTRRDHVDGLREIAWSPDGRHFAASSRRGLVTLHDANGRLLQRLSAGGDETRLLQFSPDGALLAVVADRQVWAWRADTGAKAFVLECAGADIADVRFAPDSGVIVTGCLDGVLQMWRAQNGVLVSTQIEPAGVDCLAVIPDGRVLAGLRDGTVRIHDAKTWRELARLDATMQRSCTILTTSTRIVTSGRKVTIWDSASLRPIATIASDDKHIAAGISLDGAHLITRRGDTATVWDLDTGKWLAALPHPNLVFSSRFSHDGARIATAAMDRAFRIWDAETQQIETAVDGSVTSPRAPHSTAWAIDAQFSPDDSRLLTAAGNELQLLRVGRDALVRIYASRDGLIAGSLSPDERHVAGAGNGVEIWDVDTARKVAHVPIPGVTLYDLAWSPDNMRFAVVGSKGTARVLMASDGAPITELGGHEGTVNRVMFSPDGTHVVTTCDDHLARVWDAASARLVMTLSHPDRVLGVSWSPDGRQLVTAGWDQALRRWDSRSGQLLATIHGGDLRFLDVAFSPDGRTLAATSHSGVVALWDVASGARRLALIGHTGPVTAVAWSPDGQLLATSAADSTARVWDAATGRQLAQRAQLRGAMQVTWTRDGTRIVLATAGLAVWDTRRDTHSVTELIEFIARRVPWRLVDGRLEPVMN